MPEKLKQRFYLLKNESYHRGLGAFAVSKSGLKIFDDSPRIYKYQIDHPEELDVFDRKHMSTFNPGTALHTYILERDNYEKEIYIIEDKVSISATLKNTVRMMGKTPIRMATHEMILAMDKLLHSGEHETAREALEDPNKCIEYSGFWKDDETGIWLKTRPDLLLDVPFIWDIKTHGKGNTQEKWENEIVNYGYHMQAAMALDGCTAITGIEHKFFGHIVFEIDQPPYDIAVYILDQDIIEFGRLKYKDILYRLAGCLEKDKWPGRHPDEPIRVNAPSWAIKQPKYYE